MRTSFQKKKSKFMTKRQEIISSDLSQSKSSLREAENENRNSNKNGLKKALQQLQMLLMDEQEVREDLQNKINHIQLRTIQRQQQFRRIIEETIPFCIKERSANVIHANLKSVHQKIINFFQATQLGVEQHLIEEKKLLQQQMERKIEALTIHVERELQQNRRLQSLNYQTIHREITKAMNLSTSILSQNQSMKKRIKELQFTNQIHQEEKQLLIAQILQKKNLIQKLYSQLRVSYEQEDRVNEEMNFIREEKKRMQEERNTRVEMEGCFKTIQNSKFKPTRLFHTQDKAKQNDRSKDAKKTIKTQTSTLSNNFNAQRIYSTIDVKAHNSLKTSLNKPFTLIQRQQSGSPIVYQLRESLKRQKQKTTKQSKKIEYLIGYKRSIDLFLKQCYNNGNLNNLNKQKIEILLRDLRDKIQSDSDLKEYPNKGSLQSSGYKQLIQQFQ